MSTGTSATAFGRMRAPFRGCLLMAGLLGAAAASAQLPPQEATHPCGELRNAFGPFDYRVHKKELATVEAYHFQPEFENLTGELKQYAAADHDYVLRAFPNHHRALLAMVRNVERLKNPKPNGAKFSVDCYFDRAMRLAPDDMIVRMIYARYLGRNEHLPDAMKVLEFVATTATESAFTQYNVGMLYFEFKRYDKALAQAHVAAGMGLQRNDLRDLLKAAGKWVDAPPRVADAASATSAGAASPASAASAASAPSAGSAPGAASAASATMAPGAPGAPGAAASAPR